MLPPAKNCITLRQMNFHVVSGNTGKITNVQTKTNHHNINKEDFWLSDSTSFSFWNCKNVFQKITISHRFLVLVLRHIFNSLHSLYYFILKSTFILFFIETEISVKMHPLMTALVAILWSCSLQRSNILIRTNIQPLTQSII